MLEQTVVKNTRVSEGLLGFSLKRRNQTILLQGTQLISGVKELKKQKTNQKTKNKLKIINYKPNKKINQTITKQTRFGFKKTKLATLLGCSERQRWDRIQINGVDSGRILRFSFGPGTGPGVENLGKTGPGSGVIFRFLSSRCLCGRFLSKDMGNLGWIDDCSRSLNRSRILKFEKLPDPDSKILE